MKQCRGNIPFWQFVFVENTVCSVFKLGSKGESKSIVYVHQITKLTKESKKCNAYYCQILWNKQEKFWNIKVGFKSKRHVESLRWLTVFRGFEKLHDSVFMNKSTLTD